MNELLSQRETKKKVFVQIQKDCKTGQLITKPRKTYERKKQANTCKKSSEFMIKKITTGTLKITVSLYLGDCTNKKGS